MKRLHGFTLVEVLVAIAIFAVLSATGWLIFDQLLKTRDRNAQHVQQLMQLQSAYAQMLRDFSQAVPINGQEAMQDYPALRMQTDRIAFHKGGVFDPLQQGLDEYEWIGYRYDAEKKALIREQTPYIYRQAQVNRQRIILLNDVENVQFTALNPQPQSQWNDTNGLSPIQMAQLPRGIEIQFDYQQKHYRWVFSLNTVPDSYLSSQQNTGGESVRIL